MHWSIARDGYGQLFICDDESGKELDRLYTGSGVKARDAEVAALQKRVENLVHELGFFQEYFKHSDPDLAARAEAAINKAKGSEV